MSRLPPGMADVEERPPQPSVDRETPAPLSPDPPHEFGAAGSAPVAAERLPGEPGAGGTADLLDLGIPTESDHIPAAAPTATPSIQPSMPVPAPRQPSAVGEDQEQVPAPDESESVAAAVSSAVEQSHPSERPPDLIELPQASTPLVPPLRRTAFPKVEVFMGGAALDVPSCPFEQRVGSVEAARWCISRRRVDTALRLLSADDDPSTSSDVRLLRFRCMVELRRYEVAAQEAAAISSSQGDATPFEVRLLAAHLPFLLNSSDAVPALGMLQELAQQVRDSAFRSSATGIDGEAICQRLQVLRSLSRVAIAAGHGAIAVDEIRANITSEEQAVAAAPDQMTGHTCELLRLQSLLGRHYVSAGDTASAAEAFEKARGCGGSEDEQVTHSLDQGLLAVASGSYADARDHFAAAASTSRAAIARASAESQATPLALSDKRVDDAVAAENNLAACRLYTRELRQAVQGLEAFVRLNPVLFLRSSVAQNLGSLYEFLPDTVSRRAVLKELASAYHLEDLGPKAFDPA